jgi:hypothetical protein
MPERQDLNDRAVGRDHVVQEVLRVAQQHAPQTIDSRVWHTFTSEWQIIYESISRFKLIR